jgi:hypothetical protein
MAKIWAGQQTDEEGCAKIAKGTEEVLATEK